MTKRQAQLELAKHMGRCFKQMALKQDGQRGQTNDPIDKAWGMGAMVAFAFAENMCKCFISASEAEEAGLGVLEWNSTGFELNTDRQP